MSSPQLCLVSALMVNLLGITTLWSQQSDCGYKIEGQVFDIVTKQPLPFVSIQLAGSSQGVESDENGYFLMESLCLKEYDVLFSLLGYQMIRHHHDYHHPEMQIYLAPESYDLEGLIVEDHHSSAGMKSLTESSLISEEITPLQSLTFGDIVSTIPGVSVLKTGQNISKPIVHGLHSNRLLILNNGVRHEYQSWGADHAPEIPSTDIERIEVVKGAGTVRFGPDALGGVIIVEPKKADFGGPGYINLSLTGNTNGQSGISSIDFGKGFKWLSFSGSAAYLKQGDLSTPDYNLENTGREEYILHGGLSFHPLPELYIKTHVNHFDQELGIFSGSFFGNLEDLQNAVQADRPSVETEFSYQIDQPKQEIQHTTYSAEIDYIVANQSFGFRAALQNNHRQEFAVRRSDAPNIDLDLATLTFDLNWHHPGLWGFEGTFGAQWLIQENDNNPGTRTVPFIPNYDQERLGVYLIESKETSSGIIEFGARFDHQTTDITGREPDNTIYRNTVTYNNFSGTVGYSAQLSERTTLSSNLGSAWRAPNMAELYRFGQNTYFIEYGLWRYTIDEEFDFVSTRDGILDQNDRDVPAETAYKWINTLNHQAQDFDLQLTGYFQLINDFIYSRPAGVTRTARGVFPFYIVDQTDAIFWGIDINASLQHTPVYSSSLIGSFLYSKQRNQDDFFALQPPPYCRYTGEIKPKTKWLDQAKFSFDLEYTFEQFLSPRIITIEEFLNAGSQGIMRFGEQASDFDILPPSNNYFLVHLRAELVKNRWQLNLSLNNALDTSYRLNTDRLRYFADDLGRNLRLQISFNL